MIVLHRNTERGLAKYPQALNIRLGSVVSKPP